MSIHPPSTANSRSTAEFDRFVMVVMLLLIFAMAARTPLDTDMWWHLQAGKMTLETGKPLLVDEFSFTRAGQPWTNHSWLAEVSMALADQAGGFLGLGLWMVTLIVFTMGILYRLLEGPPLFKAALMVLATTVIFWVWSPRPQLYSLLLFCITLVLLKRPSKNFYSLAWLVPVFMLWSNLHGGYVLGFILLIIWGCGEFLDYLLTPEVSWSMFWMQVRSLLVWGAAAGVAILLNPNGIETWLIPFKTVGVNVLQQLIDEWASPNFHEAGLQPFLILLFLCVGVMVCSPRKVRGVDLVGVVVLAAMSLIAKRNFGPFVLFATPVVTRYGWPLIQKIGAKFSAAKTGTILDESQPGAIKDRLRKAINLLLVAILALAAFGKLYAVTQPSLVDAYIQQGYPVGAVDHLKEQQYSGTIFNTYAWGGYLDWELPQAKVFVDGRTDLFGDEILEDYLTMFYAEEGWEAVMTKWQIQTVLVEIDAPLAAELKTAGWQVTVQDDVSVLLEAGTR